jgi:hypothetical protein
VTRREIIAGWLAERDGFQKVSVTKHAALMAEAGQLLDLIDSSPLWTVTDICNYTGLTSGTISSYRARSQMPAPDLSHGRTWLWEPDTIRAWRPPRRP